MSQIQFDEFEAIHKHNLEVVAGELASKVFDEIVCIIGDIRVNEFSGFRTVNAMCIPLKQPKVKPVLRGNENHDWAWILFKAYEENRYPKLLVKVDRKGVPIEIIELEKDVSVKIVKAAYERGETCTFRVDEQGVVWAICGSGRPIRTAIVRDTVSMYRIQECGNANIGYPIKHSVTKRIVGAIVVCAEDIGLGVPKEAEYGEVATETVEFVKSVMEESKAESKPVEQAPATETPSVTQKSETMIETRESSTVQNVAETKTGASEASDLDKEIDQVFGG